MTRQDKSPLIQLVAPYWTSPEKWVGVALAAILLALGLSQAGLGLLYNEWYGNFFRSLQKMEADKFWSTLPLLVVFLMVSLLVIVADNFVREWLQLRWRRSLFDHQLTRWLSVSAYYRIERDGLSENPDQRMAEDIRQFIVLSIELTIGFVTMMATLATYSYLTWTKGGALEFAWLGFDFYIAGYMFWLAFAFAMLDWAVTHWAGWRLLGLNYRNEAAEADLRYALVQVRDNAEQIALYRGEVVERENLMERFGGIWRVSRETFIVTARLNFASGFNLRLAALLPLVVMAPQMLTGQIDLGTLMATSAAWASTVAGFGWFAGNYKSIANWRAVVRRLALLNEAIDSPDTHNIRVDSSSGNGFRADNVRLMRVTGENLADVGSFQFGPGERWLVVGPSGVGKSTLLRAIAGMWPHGAGRIFRPGGLSWLFLPQKSYIPSGPLKAALCYPSLPDRFSDAQCVAMLKECELADFVGQLHRSGKWSRSMSMGEQQRLAFARVLLHRPDFLFLDEATSALDDVTERRLYETLLEHLPDSGIISVAHRSTLRAFHDHVLELGMSVSAKDSLCPPAVRHGH